MSGCNHARTLRAAHRRRSARLALIATVAASLVFSGTGVATAFAEDPPSSEQVSVSEALNEPAPEIEPEEQPAASEEQQPEDAAQPPVAGTPDVPVVPPTVEDESPATGTLYPPNLAAEPPALGPQSIQPLSDPPSAPPNTAPILVRSWDRATVQYGSSFLGQPLGFAQLSNVNWEPGETVTVSVTYTRPVVHCSYVSQPGSIYEQTVHQYGIGTSVAIIWSGAEPVSVSPTHGTPPFSSGGAVYSGGGSVSWQPQGSDRIWPFTDPEDGIKPGTSYSATFVAPDDTTQRPLARINTTALPENACNYSDAGHSATPTVRLTGFVEIDAGTADSVPHATFVAAANPSDPFEIVFENRSADPEDAATDLGYLWDFGDGSTSTAQHPTHRYEAPGTYTVTLTVTDSSGQTSTATQEIQILTGLIVNSTGDGSAEDPADGCDTGGTVNGEPECTLRAAIEAANAAGGGEITFDIAGTPVIALGSTLPRIETAVTVDGTTQSGGWVEVIGGGLAGLRLAGPGSEVSGLALHGAEYGVGVNEGEHRLTGVRLGLDRSGASTGDTEVGLGLQGGRVSLNASEVAAEVGVSASGPVEITGSRIGVDSAGTAIPGVDAGILIAGPESVVTGSTIHGKTVGVLLYGAGASDAQVRDNVIGTEDSGIGVSVQGAPGASITGNTIVADGHAGVLVSGSNQTTEMGDELVLNSPLDEPAAGAVTGGDTLVEGNTIAGDTLRAGVWAWAGADRVTVTDTVIAGTQYGVILDGGAGHTVRGSTIGSADVPVGLGIDAQNVSALRIGDTTAGGNVIVADGDVGIRLGLTGTNNQVGGNTITAAGTIALTATGSGTLTVVGNVVRAQAGFTIDDDFASLTVVGNTLTSDSPESGQLSGILAAAGVLEVRGNEVTGFGTGIAAEAPAATVTENIVLDAAIGGIVVAGDGSEVTGNRVAGSADGIVVAGQGVTVAGNRVGLEATGDTVVGNSGTGILVRQGRAEVRGNAVAGSGEHGIDVASGATATLTANRIWLSGGQAIRTATGPDAPTLRAAIAVYGQPNATRTTLLIEDIPEGASGRIEVFADDSCTAPGGEAKHVLSATRTIEAGQTTRIVHLATGHDHLTVTYTDPTGNTSALSDCATRTDYADADNDGSVDPLDAILGWEADPTSGLVATPNEELLLVRAAPEFDSGGDLGTIGGGVLRQLRIGEQPAGLPAGASMPYGAVFFEVHGIEPGGRAVVVLASLNENVPQGTSYWKYGPATPGAAPSWYDFVFDQASFTGARMTTSDFGGALRNSYTLILADGGRGDADNTANGIVVDPGGPVLFAGSTPGGIGSLPATGSDSAGLQLGLSIALLLAALGSALLMLRDRRWKQPRLRR